MSPFSHDQGKKPIRANKVEWKKEGRPALLSQATENRFRSIIQFFTNEVSLSACEVGRLFHYLSEKCVCVVSALIDATGFSVLDRDFCAKRRYGHKKRLGNDFLSPHAWL